MELSRKKMILLIKYYTASSVQSVICATHVSGAYDTLVARSDISCQFVISGRIILHHHHLGNNEWIPLEFPECSGST